MVTEMSQAETCRVNQMSDRKRTVYEAPQMTSCATQTEQEDVKRPRVEDAPPTTTPAPNTPTNNGWGELFKDRDTFVEMHIC